MILPAMPTEYGERFVSVDVDGYLNMDIGSDVLEVYRQDSISIFSLFGLINVAPGEYQGETAWRGPMGSSRDYQQEEKDLLVRGVVDAIARVLIQADRNALKRRLLIEGAKNEL